MADEEEKKAQPDSQEDVEKDAEEELPAGEEPEETEEKEGDDDEKIPLTVSVSDEGQCRKRVKIEIGADRVSKDIREGLKDIRSSVPLPGFRKGRAPTSLLSRRYGKKIREEVRATLVSGAVVQSLETEKIRAFSMPEFDEEALEKIEVDVGKALVFEFSVDVKPDIDVDNYVGLKAERPKVEVKKEEVDQELERILTQRGRVVPVEDGAVEYRDILVVNREYTYRKKVVHEEENETIPVPDEGSEMYKTMPFLKDMVGKKAGEVLERTFKFPDDFKVEEMRGRQGKQRIIVQDIKRLEIPEVDDELLEELGVKSEEELRSRISERLQAAKDAMADQIAENNIVDVLLETVPIDLPETVVEREVDQHIRRYEIRLRDQKVPEGEIEERIDKIREQSRKDVEKEFRAFFLLEEIARKEKIFTTEEDVDQRIEAMAANYGKWPSQMKEELEEAKLLDQLRGQLKEEKVKTFLREKAELEEGEEEGEGE
ncbi:MAG: trigger factor [Planctomycetota bacterium]|jgi:trigger factor